MLTSTLYSNVILWQSNYKTAFTIGGLEVQWYAIISIIGYLTAILIYLLVLWKRYKVSVDVGFYYVFVAIPLIILGARAWSFMIGDAHGDFFNFRNGGLAIQGGVIFGVIGALIYFPIILHFPKFHTRVIENGKVYIKRPSMWIYADAIIPTILIGQAIGRWGNFMNGEIYGAATDPSNLQWLKNLMPGVFQGMQGIVTQGSTQLTGVVYQPLFLYESFMNIIAFIVIYGLIADLRFFKAGTTASLYFVSYGIIRFIMEPMRASSFQFKGTYILNGLLLAIGIVMFIYCQWFAVKIRDYKIWQFIKRYISSIFKSQKMTLKSIKQPEFIRYNSDKIFYAYR